MLNAGMLLTKLHNANLTKKIAQLLFAQQPLLVKIKPIGLHNALTVLNKDID